jgi:hypothetical protein
MVTHANRVLAVLVALAVGVVFVLTVRTAGLREIAQRAHCASAGQAAQFHACRSSEDSSSLSGE